jgi:hypothetical protein
MQTDLKVAGMKASLEIWFPDCGVKILKLIFQGIPANKRNEELSVPEVEDDSRARF